MAKPILIVASHKTDTDAQAKALEKRIASRRPDFDVVVIPQATGVVIHTPISAEDDVVPTFSVEISDEKE